MKRTVVVGRSGLGNMSEYSDWEEIRSVIRKGVNRVLDLGACSECAAILSLSEDLLPQHPHQSLYGQRRVSFRLVVHQDIRTTTRAECLPHQLYRFSSHLR